MVVAEDSPFSMTWTFRIKTYRHQLARANFSAGEFVTEGQDVAGLPIVRKRQDAVQGRPYFPPSITTRR